jgi:hypothetical protein
MFHGGFQLAQSLKFRRVWEISLFLLPRRHVFLLLPSIMSIGFPRLAVGWVLRHWLKHPRNLTSKCVTGCQCLYTWRRLVERIWITGLSVWFTKLRMSRYVRSCFPLQDRSVYFDIGRRDFTADTEISDSSDISMYYLSLLHNAVRFLLNLTYATQILRKEISKC